MKQESQHPSWREMFVQGSFDELVMQSLPVLDKDRDAARYFLMVFSISRNVFMLSDQCLALIKEYAARGDRYALFALGRHQLCTVEDNSSIDMAEKYISKSHELGLADATVSLSLMYACGNLGTVDRSKSRQLLADALERACAYASYVHLKNLIFGLNGFDTDIGKALGCIRELIAADINLYGEAGVNPAWYYLEGCALQKSKGYAAAKGSFLKAAEAGVVMAWTDVAVALYLDDNGLPADGPAYMKALKHGKEKGDAFCKYLLDISVMADYANKEAPEQPATAQKFIEELTDDWDRGVLAAAATLGEIYYYGKYGIAEDNMKAWQWYAAGLLRNDVGCCEKLFNMIRNHDVDVTEDVKDMIILKGARLGSKSLLAETVIAYTYGRLTEFAAEIEQYYIPVFDGVPYDYFPESIPDNWLPYDDGRFDIYS